MIELKGQIGKYKILKKLGSGGFGTIYLAEDTFLKTQRALKIPHRIGTDTEKLLQESVLQSKLLDHPHIVKLLAVDIIDRTIIMVMEYIKGTDIETLIDEVIAANPDQFEQLKGGKDKLMGFFVGQVMKASKGKANPAQVNELMRKKLDS